MKSVILATMLTLASACVSQVTAQTISVSESGYMRVIGKGKTFDEAKTNGFNNAIEIVVGSVVLADAELSKNQFVRDDIAKHSAGYVEDYKIINRSETSLGVTLVMDIRVASSKIHERVLNKPNDSAKVEGEKLADQYNTYMQSRTSGDKLLNMVLSDYPRRAFNVKQGKTAFKLDAYRNAILVVEYELSWNYKYLQALNEALSVTNDENDRGLQQQRVFVVSKDPDAWLLGSTKRHYFNDAIRARRVKQTFTGTVTVWAEIKDINGKTLFSGCSNPTYMVSDNIVSDPMIIRGTERIENEVLVKIPANNPLSQQMNNAVKVELSFASGGCYNYNQ